jgi:GntR family transcriptional regulator
VRRSRYVQPLGTLYSLFRAIEAQGIPQRSEVLAFDARPDAAAAAVFGVDPSTDLVHLERLRFAGDDPLALDTSWLHPDVGPAVLGADMTRTALYDEIERRAGRRITGGEDVVGARIPDASLRDALHLEPDEAVLRIERLGESDGRIVECRVTLVRAGLFALVMRWPTVGAIESRFDLSGDRDEAVRPASTSPRL